MRIIAFEPDWDKQHQAALRAMAAGIPGCEVRTLGDYVECDIAVIFGGYKYAFAKTKPKQDILQRHQGMRLLMVEAAFVKRGEYYQAGWGGMAGAADFNADDVPSGRWDSIGVPVSPWQHNTAGHIVVMGQLGRDVQVQDVDHYGWVRETIQALQGMVQRVIFRPHPKEDPAAYGVPADLIHRGTMAEALAGARSVVTWNSTSAVDAIIAGVPVVAMDSGSIAYRLAGHTLSDAVSPHYPDRQPWLNMLGYGQWTLQEMQDGTAWRHLGGYSAC